MLSSANQQVSGQFFSPISPSQGEAIKAYIDVSDLVITAATGSHSVHLPLAALKPRYGGFNREQVYFDWESPQGDACSVCFKADDAERLMSQAQPAASQTYQQVHSKHKNRKRWSNFGLAMLAVYILLPFLILLVLLWKSHQVAAWIADFIPLEQEKVLGELVFEGATDGMKLRQTGYDYEVLKSMGERLTKDSAYEYQWYIADTDEVNAFAVPGGYVVANTGLLQRANSAEEVAGVLAHEVQHVEQRHTLEDLIYQVGWQSALALMLGDASSLWVAQAATELNSLKFSRELEAEADLKGLDALHKAQISPQGMITFFDNLAKEEGDFVPALLSTHPASDARSTALQKAIKSNGQWDSAALPYDWDKVKAASSKAN